MRVLTTNCALRSRSGTEIVTMDLAAGLRQRGHDVAVFAPLLGPSAEILRGSSVIVTDRPEDIPWRPDVIHGHHNHVVAAAMAYFHDSPGLFVCHSATYWFDGPPLLPRLKRLCAVDEACRARVVAETGCSTDDVVLLMNAVDTTQFTPRTPLPATPARALLLAKNTAHVAAIRDATRAAGLALDEVGSAFGREVDDLPRRLKDYDLVFASARMALEAMAVGCAVIVVDGRGLAGLATSDVLEAWRIRNFGVSVLARPVTTEAISAEIARYDAADAAIVSGRIREVATLPAYLDRVEALHREIAAAPIEDDPAADLRASASFMAQWLRRLGEGTIPENFDRLHEANNFAAEHRGVLTENASLRDDVTRLTRERDEAVAQMNALETRLRTPLGALRYHATAWRGRRFDSK